MTGNFLDQLILARKPLPALNVVSKTVGVSATTNLDLSVRINAQLADVDAAATTHKIREEPNSRGRFRLQRPLVVRHISAQELDSSWDAFCGLLREHGLALACPVEELDSVGIENLPARFGRRSLDGGFLRSEVDHSDAFELDCCRHDDVWGWPAEIGDRSGLEPLIEVSRVLPELTTPIGITLPADVHADDLSAALASQIDFITLVAAPGTPMPVVVNSLVQLRRMCEQRQQRDFPIILDAQLNAIREIPICLALGASAVAIDCFLRPLFVELHHIEAPSLENSLFRGIAAPELQVASPLTGIDRRIAEISGEIERQMRICGAASLDGLNLTCLRALSPEAARLAGVQLMA